jgi:hypothetical protein
MAIKVSLPTYLAAIASVREQVTSNICIVAYNRRLKVTD